MGPHLVTRPECAELRYADADEGERPKWRDLFTKMALAAFAPRPTTIELIGRDRRHEVAGQRRQEDAGGDLETVEDRDGDQRDDRRTARDQRVADELLSVVGLGPGPQRAKTSEHSTHLSFDCPNSLVGAVFAAHRKWRTRLFGPDWVERRRLDGDPQLFGDEFFIDHLELVEAEDLVEDDQFKTQKIAKHTTFVNATSAVLAR